MPTTTYEIRWFVRELPFAPDRVFGIDEQPEERTDWYAPAGDSGTGTKLREGRLETKLRTDIVEHVDVSGCRGVMERWQKWSVVLVEEGPGEQLLLGNGWIPIHKRRWLQVWSTENNTLTIVKERVGQGALFELTELNAPDGTWWTVGFEAFGPEGTRRESLERVMAHVLEELPAHRSLGERESMGYPAWLMVIAATG